MAYRTNGRFYLYVHSKPGFNRKPTATYFSYDNQGPAKAVDNLIKRILHRSQKGKFEWAKLVDQETGEIKAYFTEKEMFTAVAWAERWKSLKKNEPHLKASMAFSDANVVRRQSFALPPLQTLYAGQKNEYGASIACALVNLRRQILATKEQLGMEYRMVYVWQHPGNKRVGQILPGSTMEMEVFDKGFYQELRADKAIPEQLLRIQLKQEI